MTERDDRPHVERLADEWEANHAEREAETPGIETWFRVAAHDLRAAIEADQAAGLLRVPEAIAGQDVRGWHQAAHSLHAEVERLERWKTEANEVLGAWTSVWVALGQPGRLGDSIAAESLAEVERLKAETPTVEIERQLGQPTTCTVTHQGRTLFDGVSRDALVEREADSLRHERERNHAVVRADRAEAKLAALIADSGAFYQDMAEEHERATGKLYEIRALADELMAFDCVDDLVPSNVDVPDDFEHGIHDAAHRLRAVLDEGGDQ